MKKVIKILFLSGSVLLLGVSISMAQVIVVRPQLHKPAITVHPPAPSSEYVWIGEEWVPSGEIYVFSGNRWASPPHAGAKWIRGKWHHIPDGWVWWPGVWD